MHAFVLLRFLSIWTIKVMACEMAGCVKRNQFAILRRLEICNFIYAIEMRIENVLTSADGGGGRIAGGIRI